MTDFSLIRFLPAFCLLSSSVGNSLIFSGSLDAGPVDPNTHMNKALDTGSI